MHTLEVYQIWNQKPRDEMVSDVQWEKIAQLVPLTRRELQVCKLLFFGYTRQEVADELNIKNRTARKYTEQLHDKLHVTNRASLVLRIIQIRDQFPDATQATSSQSQPVTICITCRKVIITKD